MNNKYQHGKIYKIISNQTNEIYIGSTIYKLLSERMRNHRSDYRKWKCGKYHWLSSF